MTEPNKEAHNLLNKSLQAEQQRLAAEQLKHAEREAEFEAISRRQAEHRQSTLENIFEITKVTADRLKESGASYDKRTIVIDLPQGPSTGLHTPGRTALQRLGIGPPKTVALWAAGRRIREVSVGHGETYDRSAPVYIDSVGKIYTKYDGKGTTVMSPYAVYELWQTADNAAKVMTELLLRKGIDTV